MTDKPKNNDKKTALIELRQEKVNKGFWPKLMKFLGRVPFVDDAVAAYYCTLDPTTPLSARATLLGALAYFIMPIDVIPDFIALLGFTDDAAVLAMAIAMANAHIKPAHRKLAADTLGKKLKDTDIS